MPTYDYVCEACSHEMEVFQSISAKVLRKCPECDKLKLKRLIGAGGGLIFKGSGFYITDYRSDAYKKKAEAEKKSSSPESKSESSSSDAETGTKTESKKETKKESKPKKADS